MHLLFYGIEIYCITVYMYYCIYFKFIISLMSVRTKGDLQHMQFSIVIGGLA